MAHTHKRLVEVCNNVSADVQIRRDRSFVSEGITAFNGTIAALGSTGSLGSYSGLNYRDIMVQIESGNRVRIFITTSTGTIDHAFFGPGSYHHRLQLGEGEITNVEVFELDNSPTRAIVNLTRIDSIF